MRAYELNLNPNNKAIQVISDDNKKETNVFLYAPTNKSCDLFNLLFKISGTEKTDTLKCNGVHQIDISKYYSLDIEAHFLGDGYVKGEVYVGSWAETLLKEIELTLDRFYVDYDKYVKNSFTIGLDGFSTIKVSPDADGNYKIVIRIVDRDGGSSDIQDCFTQNYGSIPTINSIYQRIVSRYNEDNFKDKQKSIIGKLTEYLEYRIREGYERK